MEPIGEKLKTIEKEIEEDLTRKIPEGSEARETMGELVSEVFLMHDVHEVVSHQLENPNFDT